MARSSDDLLRQCKAAIQESDFPTVWDSLLRTHQLVVGPPVQYMNGDRAELHVRLLTGERLIFDSSEKTFLID